MRNREFHNSKHQIQPTPLQRLTRLSRELGIDLRVKRDDLYPFAEGGNKARKIRYILFDAKKTGANALVTAGAGNSNHVRVTAIAGAMLGWKVRVMIHDSNTSESPNLKLTKLTRAEVIYAKMPEVEAYFNAVSELEVQAEGWQPDFVILASGTGGTQAGLHTGFAVKCPETRIVGISIARDQKRGVQAVAKSLTSLKEHLQLKLPEKEVVFLDAWNGGGYEKKVPGVTHVIRMCAEQEGLFLDPVYTGKAMKALFDLRNEGFIQEGCRVLFWHTGGLLNVLNAKDETI